ncbi:radical SAM family heme chaperone HemW [Sedimentibacter sp. zth1]|uniref:radical SAM family heme chaperone HemW n=1 Tax=Sedimentibacter sp. zth1 TaxID=2816908 RepID=UPI001A924CFA|nr:radical SAM family heme chaperone HemW [Sedimentibacter sp. zth1]QSX07090.1 radical SAM family heme chaperone HemW [Sedimentibacter sp. zth1]
MKKLGLYVHIPFCERKCNYCDFYSLVKTDEIEANYIESLLYELKSYKEVTKGYIVDSIFIGGGTPSYLRPDYIGLILDEIRNNFVLSEDVEISMEANPNSITLEKAKLYKKYGLNRMSVGIQSLDNKILKLIGRLHTSDEAINAIKILKKAGFTNINADVIFNIPGQNVENIIDTLSKIIDQDVNHISFYSLKLEQGTPMYRMEERGEISLAEDEEERAMYYAGRDFMEKNNYFQYEISNFSKKGFECRHNIKYWIGEEYIGFGPFSHSCFKDKRYNNISDIRLYCDNIKNPTKFRHLNEVLNIDSKIFEYIMLRLRMNKGFTLVDFKGKFNLDFEELYQDKIEKLVSLKLLIFQNGSVCLTKKGMDVSNYVFEEFLE